MSKKFAIHRLVAIHFIPNPHNKPQVNHIDGNKTNNHFLNLEWCTAQENADHAVENNLRPRGEGIGRNGLIEKNISAIRQLRDSGKTYSFIAKKFGVSINAIVCVTTNKTWRHIK